MSATLRSPSRSIEDSLLSLHQSSSTTPPPSIFPRSPLHHSASDAGVPVSPQQAPLATDDQDAMEVQPSPLTTLDPSVPVDPVPSQPSSEQNVEAIDGQDHDRIDTDMDGADGPNDPPSRSENATPVARDQTTTDHEPSSTEETAQVQSPTVPESSNDAATESTEDSDDDSYDGDREFISNLQDDNSVPSKEELEEIERHPEPSALEHERWEDAVFRDLDDPEYEAVGSGRISWTLTVFHGTKDAPNKLRMMRSPTVMIAGFNFRLKIFPHGCDETDMVSVYLECTGPAAGDTAMVDDTGTVSAAGTAFSASTASGTKGSWEVPAQIGCVMYNPQDPRVYAFNQASHMFENDSVDWGWVRYHGPWDSLHVRNHLARRAMLQKDTIAFTAYIRVVKDPTRSLWWHQGDGPCWDSMAKTGYRALSVDTPVESAMSAALLPWCHLTRFVNLVQDCSTPGEWQRNRKRERPLFDAIKSLLSAKNSTDTSSSTPLRQVMAVLQWYGYVLDSSVDVVEIWDILRHLLNKEYRYTQPDVGSQDVLGFIKTVRRSEYPLLPNEAPSQTQFLELHTIQDVVNSAPVGTEPDTKVRDVLQIELPRHRYDHRVRKWKRMTHKIALDPVIRFAQKDYTLYGMVVHSGELGSGNFFPIVRSSGPNSKWLKYSTDVHSDCYATFLTHKQAIDVNEGGGLSGEGVEPVAYVALYALSEALTGMFPEPRRQGICKIDAPSEKGEHRDTPSSEQDQRVHVTVFNSSGYSTHKEPFGFIDPWMDDQRDVFTLAMSGSSTVQDLRKEIVERFDGAQKPEQCRVWQMNKSYSYKQYSPVLIDIPLGATITGLSGGRGEVYIWLHILPQEMFPDKKECSSETKDSSGEAGIEPPNFVNPTDTSSSDRSAVNQTESTVPHVPSDANAAGGRIDNENNAPGDDVVMGGTQELHERNEVRGPDGTHGLFVAIGGGASALSLVIAEVNQDRTMSEPTVTEFSEPPPPPPPPSAQTWQEPSDHVYFFVKVFDAETQSVKPAGSFFIPRRESIGDALIRLGVVKPDTSYDLHEEVQHSLDYAPKKTRSFSSARISSGAILVVQKRLSSDDKAVVKARGDSHNAPHYFKSMTLASRFDRNGPHRVFSYFGGTYSSTPLLHGRPNGLCTLIEPSGDAYHGNCVASLKSGQGTMYFANGDTYTGKWDADSPNGTGIMIYANTGNKYVGGWKNGRRHGKGTMAYEVADEEQQLCKICYESEMNALFYRCGHVVACETCAGQVRDCPVCRRPVDAVVRIWRT